MKTFLLLILILSGQLVYAQPWIRYYGQGQNAIAWNVTEQSDKGYLIAGGINLSTYSWLLKTDVNGNLLWDKKFGTGNYITFLMNVEQTFDGGFILCGSTMKLSSNDAFILKLNPCAEVEWCKILEGPNNFENGIMVKQSSDGGYVVLTAYYPTIPESNISLFKLNPTGEIIWRQFYPYELFYNQDQPYDLQVDSDSYLITASRNYADTVNGNPAYSGSYFISSDTAGVKQWDMIYGENKYYFSDPWKTTRNSNGKYYHSCTHSATTEINPGLIWISHDGSEAGDKDIFETGSPNFCGLSTITMLHDTNLVFFGGYTINDVFEYKVIRTDTMGNILKNSSIPELIIYNSTTKTFDDKFIAVGVDTYNNKYRIVALKVNSNLEYDSIYTQPLTYDSLCPHPIISDTIDPNCDNVIVSVDEPFKKPETTQLKVYPNPTDKILTVELPKYLVVSNKSGSIPATTIYHQWSSATLQAIDLQGKTVLQQEVANTGTPLQVDVSRLPAGMYQFRLLYKGKQVAGSKVVVK